MDTSDIFIKQEQSEFSFDSIVLGINESLQMHEEKIARQLENCQSSVKYMLELQEHRSKTRHEELLHCLQQIQSVLQQRVGHQFYRPDEVLRTDDCEKNDKNDPKNNLATKIFKVWTADRTKKVFVTVNKNSYNIHSQLLSKASEKLNIYGHHIVTEDDGTVISDNETVLALKHQTLILLRENESWAPASQDPLTTSATENHMQVVDVFPSTSVSFPNPQLQDRLSDVDVVNFDFNQDATWANFEVKWDLIPRIARESFERGEKDGGHMRTMVQAVVQQMREIRTRIPLRGFKLVAEKIANKYPRTFKDIDTEGVLIGDGYHSLTSKLEDRNAYLNRPSKSSDNPTGRKRRHFKAGCSNWIPSLPPDVSNSLKDELNSYVNKEVDEQFYSLLSDTYVQVRAFLERDDVPTVEDILNEWPVLLKPETIAWHFQFLTNKSLSDLSKNLCNKTEQILNYGLKKHFQARITSDMPPHMQALEYVSHNFTENLGLFIKTFGIENLEEESMSPFVLEYADPDSKKEYTIYYERKPVITCKDVLQAVELGFALYVIFNLPYPKDISATMELIERYFYKIHPNDGSRIVKSRIMKRKVINFMVKLSSL